MRRGRRLEARARQYHPVCAWGHAARVGGHTAHACIFHPVHVCIILCVRGVLCVLPPRTHRMKHTRLRVSSCACRFFGVCRGSKRLRVSYRVCLRGSSRVCLRFSFCVCLRVSSHVCLRISSRVRLRVSSRVCLRVSSRVRGASGASSVRGRRERRLEARARAGNCAHAQRRSVRTRPRVPMRGSCVEYMSPFYSLSYAHSFSCR
jgi:hypothetical protein